MVQENHNMLSSRERWKTSAKVTFVSTSLILPSRNIVIEFACSNCFSKVATLF